MSSIPPIAAVNVHAARPPKPLTKAADGDYTAASIAANPGSAVGKVKEADGDYRVISGGAAAQTSPAMQVALCSLKNGGS